jgi:ribonuclease HI
MRRGEYSQVKSMCYSDSLLVMNQLQGKWKVKHPQMRDYYENVTHSEGFKKLVTAPRATQYKGR